MAVKIKLTRLGKIDRVNFGGVRVDPGGSVTHHRVVFPRRFPQLVENFEVLVRVVVAIVVLELVVLAHVPCGRREVSGDHVPPD